MLEYFANQASGLIGLGAQPGPRLMAVVSHGDEQAELPLLWQLSMALVNFGYTLTVLDGTGVESESNPGLLHMLNAAGWCGDEYRHAGAWTVLPASAGIQKLCSPSSSPAAARQQLGQLFPPGSIVITYCKVEWIIALLGESMAEPLLAVSPARNSLLTCYMALKRLLIIGKLRPTIINMISELPPPPSSHRSSKTVSASLSECAKRFLHHTVKTVDIVEQQGEEALRGDAQRLALRLLEGAPSLDSAPGVHSPVLTHAGMAGHFAGSH